MVTIILTAVLAAPNVAAFPLQTVNVDQKVGELALAHVAERLGQRGLQVMTPAEIQAIVGLERQKQLLGCTDQASACSAELADALGAEATMVGTLGKLGDTFELSIKVVSNRSGGRKAGFTERVKSEGELFAMLDRAADSLAEQLGRAPAPGVVAGGGGAPRLRRFALIPGAVAAVGVVGAGVSFGLAREAHLDLTDSTRPAVANPAARAAAGQQWQTVSAVAAGVAVASAAVAAWFFVSGEETPAAPAVTLSASGAPTLVVGGRLP